MKRNIWILVILVAVMGALDALQPFMAQKQDTAAGITFAEMAELWGFVGVVIAVAITIVIRRRRSKK